MPILSKIIERAVHSQVTEYLEQHKLLSDSQFGYRKKRSTEQATILLRDEIRKHVNEGKLVGAVFIDLSRAFDTINHANLTEKLRVNGINGSELEWFQLYLFNRKQIIVLDGAKSKEEPVTSGVPHRAGDTVLKVEGPIFF